MNVQVVADFAKCEGFASCVIVAPEVFDLDDDNVVRVLDEQPDESRRAEVEEAVRNCPRRAIWLEEM
ncbi:ferredoxin [Saccharopolyspora sp. K220]|uniref:ferredoxin n=1 Tax=Saccharopolyspora soli TaxID=2926618 RepID=UPI001F55D73B|nr:ferredoxin [Saccharopolyspora soli]MCI2423763.1 ferredoxin [Saccharopolyspora soli]